MEYKRVTKIVLYAIATIISIACLFLLGGFGSLSIVGISDYYRNNQQLASFAKNIIDYPLPPDTIIIDTSKDVSLQGSGNHCDFVVEVELHTNLTEYEIKQYYSLVEFPPVRTEKQGYEDTFTSGFHVPITPIINFVDIDSENGNLVVILKYIDAGYPPGWDYRCH